VPGSRACGSILPQNKNRETARMRLAAPEGDDREALPTEGMDVQEVRDTDGLRLFILEWHEHSHRQATAVPAGRPRSSCGGGMMGP
jgi:hypothetical protein